MCKQAHRSSDPADADSKKSTLGDLPNSDKLLPEAWTLRDSLPETWRIINYKTSRVGLGFIVGCGPIFRSASASKGSHHCQRPSPYNEEPQGTSAPCQPKGAQAGELLSTGFKPDGSFCICGLFSGCKLMEPWFRAQETSYPLRNTPRDHCMVSLTDPWHEYGRSMDWRTLLSLRPFPTITSAGSPSLQRRTGGQPRGRALPQT